MQLTPLHGATGKGKVWGARTPSMRTQPGGQPGNFKQTLHPRASPCLFLLGVLWLSAQPGKQRTKNLQAKAVRLPAILFTQVLGKQRMIALDGRQTAEASTWALPL